MSSKFSVLILGMPDPVRHTTVIPIVEVLADKVKRVCPQWF
jgi:hypothetical protein